MVAWEAIRKYVKGSTDNSCKLRSPQKCEFQYKFSPTQHPGITVASEKKLTRLSNRNKLQHYLTVNPRWRTTSMIFHIG